MAAELLPDWPRWHGPPPGAARFRSVPEDFRVEEVMPFVPEGEGEHLWLWLEKRAMSTPVLVRHVARQLEVRPRDIGVSGLKDHGAVSRQWLSVWLPGAATPARLAALLALKDGASRVQLLEHARHPRKLKRGVHRANRFRLVLRDVEASESDLAARWQRLLAHGVPNYFGPQRFGVGGDNVTRALRLFARGWRRRDDREGLLLSSARSYLFNAVLAERISRECWLTPLAGDVFNLAGSASRFTADEPDAGLGERLASGDIHPTGPLWGRGSTPVQADAAEFERQVVDHHPQLRDGIEQAGATPARRPLRLMPEAASMAAGSDGMILEFTLARGGFATAVLRELIAHEQL
ncbi:TruD family tRNA pseudouridine synthase [Kushneria sinocarnis]|uniref:tRNA pseudouridine synthase D n=1 Tax=Kushneria sinocarnis TaxID=595502 RepID=A0A420WX26_9GAMM|nr:tRNA pseudouridine(13) synthase TruD [Kushneria sinocarnis]RKR04274.1 TruD family tRNA pseudouridine synthase [Kushneria sinocarnis]